MEKQCAQCKQIKMATEFNVRKHGHPGLRSDCKVCEKLRLLGARKQNSDNIKEYKKTLQCQSCGIADYRVLQFHHIDRDNKNFSIANQAKTTMSWDKIKTELSKCIPLCANCHQILHYKERE